MKDYNLIYFVALLVLAAGIYIMITSDNYLKKLMGLAIFQSSVLIFYIALGKISSGIIPINICANGAKCPYLFSSPLPHVLMLTAIVVGFATLSVGLALVLRIKDEYDSTLESEINYKIPKRETSDEGEE